MIRYLLIFTFAAAFHFGSAQTLSSYTDKLFLGMLSYKPDTSIKEFVTRYAPFIYKRYDTSVKWTMYPPNAKEPKFITVTNSYVFRSHPNFKEKFKSGQLAITQNIFYEESWDGSISGTKLWFEFENELDARNVYQKLIKSYSNFNAVKRISTRDGVDKAEFTDRNSEDWYNSIQILLLKDYLIGTRHLLTTTKGTEIVIEPGYKILLEIGNHLY
jgi:hypothetical protein